MTGEGVLLGEGLRYAHSEVCVRASVEAAGLKLSLLRKPVRPQRGQCSGARTGRGRQQNLSLDATLAGNSGIASQSRHFAIAGRWAECQITPCPGRNNNEEQTDPARVRRHRVFPHSQPPSWPAPYVRAAEKKYDPGASDTEIKLGQTVPHSGPGSLYGVLGRVGEAYFQMLNEKGGINGRKVKFFTMDDAYSAPNASRRRAGWWSRKRCWRCSARSATAPADRRAQISQLQRRAAAAAQHRRVEM